MPANGKTGHEASSAHYGSGRNGEGGTLPLSSLRTSSDGTAMRLCWTLPWRCRRRRLLSLVLLVPAAGYLLVSVYFSQTRNPFPPSPAKDRSSRLATDTERPPDLGGPRDTPGHRLDAGSPSFLSSFKEELERDEEERLGQAGDLDDTFDRDTGLGEDDAEGVMSNRSRTAAQAGNSALDAAEARRRALQDFVRENTDVFSEEGDESDYLFPPCQDTPPAFRNNSVYGFVGPFRYLANYKNPCWMEPGEDAPVVYCVPYFYLAGAPKAGSTDVFRRLIMHPDIAKAASKETRWFDRGRFADKPHFSSFLRNFATASGALARSLDKGSNYHRRIIGDGSPSYFFDNRRWPLIPGNEGCSEPRVTVASHIHHLFPKARIIFILRNPVDRLYSSYLFNHKKYEQVSSTTFDVLARDAVKVYNDCFERHSLRQCANNGTVFLQAKVMLIVSLYSVFIQDWLQLFPREQLLFMTTEKYNQDMVYHLNKAYVFLGLRPLTRSEMAKITEHGVYNKGTAYKGAGPMLKETRTFLEDFYRPYNRQLAALLKDPDFLWLD